jgi:hypothetical protein
MKKEIRASDNMADSAMNSSTFSAILSFSSQP